MSASMEAKNWVAMFRELGLTDAQMQQWHRIFETSQPAAHQSFLEWLGVPAAEITRIRAAARA